MLTQREAFARLFEHMARHDGGGGHGYSQPARWGDGTTEEVDLGDGVTVAVAGGDRDCSSGVISCLRAVGVDTGDATYTGNMLGLCDSGPFEAHRRAGGRCVDGYVARRGDIYLNTSHHTAICLSADPDLLAQFSISERGTISGRTGDQTGRESNIRPYYDYPWNYTLSWVGDGETLGEPEQPSEPPYLGQEMDEMVCIIQPNGASALMYYDGHDLHDVDSPDGVTALNEVYKATHDGRDIPFVRLGTKDAPWASRLMQVVSAGAPSERLVPGLRCFPARSPREA